MEALRPENGSDEPAGLTAKVLASRAAAAALSSPAISPGQWVYRNYVVVATPENAASPVTAEHWTTADNSTAAAYVGGQLEVGPWMWPVTPARGTMKMPISKPAVSYNSLSSLPSSPRALADLLGETPVTRAKAWRPGHAFELIAELFQTYAMPPEPMAQLFRALGAINGVMADEHAVDVAGRHRLGFLLIGTGGTQEIVVDPQAYKFAGYQFFGDGRDIHAPDAWGMAILRQAPVSGPGVRPQEGSAGAPPDT